MEHFYEQFFNDLYHHRDNLSEYVDSLYENSKYTEVDLNEIFGKLKKDGLINCLYADDRAWEVMLTVSGKHYFDDEPSDDKPYLAQLISRIDDIQTKFHKWGGETSPEYESIHDVQEFQDWLQDIKFELQEIYDRTRDHSIWETIRLCEKNMDGINDRQIFSELKAKLNAIGKRINKYYSQYEPKPITHISGKGTPMNNINKQPLIFISHSSKNKEQVDMLVALLRSLNLQKQDIFCSSIPGQGIPVGEDIFAFLRSRFSDYDLHVIFVHSHEYYESPVSLNEMGAAWVMRNHDTSILLPGFDYSDMKGVVNSRSIAIKLDEDEAIVKDRLNQLRKTIDSEFNLAPVQDIIWEQSRDSFLNNILSFKKDSQ